MRKVEVGPNEVNDQQQQRSKTSVQIPQSRGKNWGGLLALPGANKTCDGEHERRDVSTSRPRRMVNVVRDDPASSPLRRAARTASLTLGGADRLLGVWRPDALLAPLDRAKMGAR